MRRIYFLLEEKWNTESLPDAAAAVRSYRKYGVDTDLWILGEQDRVATDLTAVPEPASASETIIFKDPAAVDTLFIADSARLLRQLADCGAAFCGYSHSGNAGEDLSAAEYILMEPQWVDEDSLVKIWQRQRDIPWTILETERCVVREFVPDDLDAVYELYDEEARRFLEPPSRNRSLEREILTSYIRRVYRLCGYGHWAVICKETGDLIGRMGFAFPPSESRESDQVPDSQEPKAAIEDSKLIYETTPDAMFGYLVRSDRRRQGIAREVGAAILQYGFGKLGFESIGADAAVSNTVSDKILREFSFIPVAQEQNQRYYILHETNWDRCPARQAPEGSDQNKL